MDVNPHKRHYYLVPPRNLSRKQIKTKLVRVKRLYKVILEYKNEVPQLQKWVWHMYDEIINAKFQVSMQINEV